MKKESPFLSIMLLIAVLLAIGLTSCVENYSNGERIGMITKFSESGFFWKSWEGHLNPTQTGMNSSSSEPFDFSIDNDKQDANVVATLDSAARHGWKVRLVYHQVHGKNFFNNRGNTNYFINEVEVLDKTTGENPFGFKSQSQKLGRDTVFVYILNLPK